VYSPGKETKIPRKRHALPPDPKNGEFVCPVEKGLRSRTDMPATKVKVFQHIISTRFCAHRRFSTA